MKALFLRGHSPEDPMIVCLCRGTPDSGMIPGLQFRIVLVECCDVSWRVTSNHEPRFPQEEQQQQNVVPPFPRQHHRSMLGLARNCTATVLTLSVSHTSLHCPDATQTTTFPVSIVIGHRAISLSLRTRGSPSVVRGSCVSSSSSLCHPAGPSGDRTSVSLS